MITSDLKCSQQCEYAYSKANRIMGMIRRTITYKEPKIMLSLYKTLVRSHVEYCSCVWNPSYKKDKELLEKIQHRYTKMIINTQWLCPRKIFGYRTTSFCYVPEYSCILFCFFHLSPTKDLAPFLYIPHKKPSFKPIND